MFFLLVAKKPSFGEAGIDKGGESGCDYQESRIGKCNFHIFARLSWPVIMNPSEGYNFYLGFQDYIGKVDVGNGEFHFLFQER